MSDNHLMILASDFFQSSLDTSPTSAIMRGHKQYFDQIEQLTEDQFEREKEIVDSFIKRLSDIDQTQLTNREKVTHGMLEFAPSSNKDSLLDRNWEFGSRSVWIYRIFN